MEKLAEMTLLMDIYGGLLTDKQYDVMDLYYNNDLSLQEIAEIKNISRQGVYDIVKRADAVLKKNDSSLNLLDKMLSLKSELDSSKLLIEDILNQDIHQYNREYINNIERLKSLRNKIDKVIEII